MPRVNYIPPSTQWSFGVSFDQLPLTIAVPVGADPGNIHVEAFNQGGSTPIDPEGVIVSVVFDADPPIDTPCLTVGSDDIPVPGGTLSITISAVKGCNAGPDPTGVTITGGN